MCAQPVTFSWRCNQRKNSISDVKQTLLQQSGLLESLCCRYSTLVLQANGYSYQWQQPRKQQMSFILSAGNLFECVTKANCLAVEEIYIRCGISCMRDLSTVAIHLYQGKPQNWWVATNRRNIENKNTAAMYIRPRFFSWNSSNVTAIKP